MDKILSVPSKDDPNQQPSRPSSSPAPAPGFLDPHFTRKLLSYAASTGILPLSPTEQTESLITTALNLLNTPAVHTDDSCDFWDRRKEIEWGEWRTEKWKWDKWEMKAEDVESIKRCRKGVSDASSKAEVADEDEDWMPPPYISNEFILSRRSLAQNPPAADPGPPLASRMASLLEKEKAILEEPEDDPEMIKFQQMPDIEDALDLKLPATKSQLDFIRKAVIASKTRPTVTASIAPSPPPSLPPSPISLSPPLVSRRAERESLQQLGGEILFNNEVSTKLLRSEQAKIGEVVLSSPSEEKFSMKVLNEFEGIDYGIQEDLGQDSNASRCGQGGSGSSQPALSSTPPSSQVLEIEPPMFSRKELEGRDAENMGAQTLLSSTFISQLPGRLEGQLDKEDDEVDPLDSDADSLSQFRVGTSATAALFESSPLRPQERESGTEPGYDELYSNSQLPIFSPPSAPIPTLVPSCKDFADPKSKFYLEKATGLRSLSIELGWSAWNVEEGVTIWDEFGKEEELAGEVSRLVKRFKDDLEVVGQAEDEEDEELVKDGGYEEIVLRPRVDGRDWEARSRGERRKKRSKSGLGDGVGEPFAEVEEERKPLVEQGEGHVEPTSMIEVEIEAETEASDQLANEAAPSYDYCDRAKGIEVDLEPSSTVEARASLNERHFGLTTYEPVFSMPPTGLLSPPISNVNDIPSDEFIFPSDTSFSNGSAQEDATNISEVRSTATASRTGKSVTAPQRTPSVSMEIEAVSAVKSQEVKSVGSRGMEDPLTRFVDELSTTKEGATGASWTSRTALSRLLGARGQSSVSKPTLPAPRRAVAPPTSRPPSGPSIPETPLLDVPCPLAPPSFLDSTEQINTSSDNSTFRVIVSPDLLQKRDLHDALVARSIQLIDRPPRYQHKPFVTSEPHIIADGRSCIVFKPLAKLTGNVYRPAELEADHVFKRDEAVFTTLFHLSLDFDRILLILEEPVWKFKESGVKRPSSFTPPVCAALRDLETTINGFQSTHPSPPLIKVAVSRDPVDSATIVRKFFVSLRASSAAAALVTSPIDVWNDRLWLTDDPTENAISERLAAYAAAWTFEDSQISPSPPGFRGVEEMKLFEWEAWEAAP
ncbi:hypothetical protein MNV49_002848 [Pseudohyphozyma bogoriensis]|nr:hypothetical protein MNV49_002848 [Pseudohyphozyma bogoriensis]